MVNLEALIQAKMREGYMKCIRGGVVGLESCEEFGRELEKLECLLLMACRERDICCVLSSHIAQPKFEVFRVYWLENKKLLCSNMKLKTLGGSFVDRVPPSSQ